MDVNKIQLWLLVLLLGLLDNLHQQLQFGVMYNQEFIIGTLGTTKHFIYIHMHF